MAGFDHDTELHGTKWGRATLFFTIGFYSAIRYTKTRPASVGEEAAAAASSKLGVLKNRTINLLRVKHQMPRSLSLSLSLPLYWGSRYQKKSRTMELQIKTPINPLLLILIYLAWPQQSVQRSRELRNTKRTIHATYVTPFSAVPELRTTQSVSHETNGNVVFDLLLPFELFICERHL